MNTPLSRIEGCGKREGVKRSEVKYPWDYNELGLVKVLLHAFQSTKSISGIHAQCHYSDFKHAQC